jgi:acetolactate synthase-1/2/3 large subunit
MLRVLKEHPRKGELGKNVKAWWERIDTWRRVECLRYEQGDDSIKPQYAVETLYKATKDTDFYLTSDVGQHQMFAAQFYPFEKPRRWINSGGLGTMGFRSAGGDGGAAGLPGRQVACIPARPVSRCASRSWRPASSTTCRSRWSC